MTAFTVALPADADIHAVIRAAGGNPWINRYDGDGQWTVDAPSQGALDAAAADYLATTYATERLARLKREKLAALAARRYEAEVGGLTLPSGLQVATDRESQMLITGAALYARDNLSSVSYKARSGFVTMNAVDLKSLFGAVAGHVQKCRNHEYDLAQQINAAAGELTIDAIDINAGWPA